MQHRQDQHISWRFFDKLLSEVVGFFLKKGNVFTQSSHQSNGESWDPWGSSGLLGKKKRYFKTRGRKKKKAKPINHCLLEMTDWRDIMRQDSRMPG